MKPSLIPYLIIGFTITLFCNYVHAQDPILQTSTNPTTCNGSEGSITFSALTPNASYQVTYTDDGVVIGPVTIVADAAGQITIPTLNAGLYTHFIFNLSGSIKEVFTGVVLSNPIFLPTFNSYPSICEGDPPPVLPTTSNNGYPGSWTPAVVNNQQTGVYTFVPAPGTCALPVNISIVVRPKTVPVFSFGTGLTICGSGTVPVLPNTSLNGITGTWNPAVVDPNNSRTYVFTPTTTGCVTGTTFTVTVNPTITPTFPFNASASICEGDGVPNLPQSSTNGITGNWSPAVVSNKVSGTYTFTPNAGQCAVPFTYSVTVNPIIKPAFSFALSMCAGVPAPVLPTTSDNGITGTWTPAVVSNTTSGNYTFKPTSDPCSPSVTVTVTVNPIIKPTFSFGRSQSVCINTTPPVLPGISNNGIPGTWSPAVIDNQTSGKYVFTPTAGQCADTTGFYYEVNPMPIIINTIKDTSVYDGDVLPAYFWQLNIPTANVDWIVNSNPSIGLPQTGSGPVPSFTAINMTDDSVTAIVTATPYINGCSGGSGVYRITVKPLNKDVFVPNVFSPNNDTHNDQLYVFGKYIATMELHIFNQWGQRLVTLTDKTTGWDGTFRGSPQPVGVYVYVIRVVTTDGRTINRKGSITLVR